jgi:two-component system sensor histidine kinase BaeS
MTRRFVVLLVGVVAATLLIAGLGTLVLANVRARATTDASLREQAVNVAANVGLFFDGEDGGELTEQEERQRLRQLTLLRRVVDLDGFSVLVIGANGGVDAEELPDELGVERFDVAGLERGDLQSGNEGDLVFAAAPFDLPQGRTGVIVLSQQANAGLGPAGRYFVFAALVTALGGLLAAMIAARRFVEPITAASVATTKIANGELATRLPEPPAHQRHELAELSRNVNSMAETLQRSRTLEQQFLLSISHDLRTPLTSIRGYAEALADGAGDPARAAAVITSEARRLERLVADLLDLAKLQASSFSLRLEPVDLGQLAVVAVQGFEPDAAERGIAILANTEPAALLVAADHDRLAQVAANLIENALKYADTQVRVTAHRQGSDAVLIVHDDGPGIDQRDLANVFERLYVARRRPSRQESSSGLGLAIVKQLVTSMNGDVWVTSELGSGAVFGVRLPLIGA